MASQSKPLAYEGVFGAQILTPATPMGLADLIFYESFDANLPINEVWEYGDPHTDSVRFPDHRLVHVQPGRSQGVQIRYYASKRLLEDEYNWEHSEADIGGTKFSIITRTYIQLREEWAPEQHIQGEAMPNTPASLFGTDFILARAGQKRIGDQTLDALFVLKELSYIQRCAISQVVLDLQTGNSKRSVTTVHYRGEVMFGGTPETPDYLETSIAGANNDLRLTQTDDAPPYSVQYILPGPFPSPITAFLMAGILTVNLGGSGGVSTSTAAQIKTACDDTMPVDIINGPVIVITHAPGNDGSGVVNEAFGPTVIPSGSPAIPGTTIEELAEDPNNAYWGLQSDGVFRELEQMSENWFAVTESNAIPGAGGGPLGDDNPAKTRVVTRPTPIVGDIVFYETGVMPSPVPAYGTAHYDGATYPNHKLAFIRPADKLGFLYEFVYVADRPSQDSYNWEVTQADIGSTKFNAVRRTYVTARNTFNPETPAQGAAMATAVSGLSGTYILAERKQTRSGDQEIDNLYVIDVHTYVKRATLTDVEVPANHRIGIRKESTLYYRTETISGTAVETLFANQDNAFWHPADRSRAGRQLTTAWFEVIDLIVGSAAAESAQAAYNFEHSQADIGGTKFNAVTRTVIIPRASFSPDSPAQGAVISDVPSGMFTGYILGERKQSRFPNLELDMLFVIDQQTYVERDTIGDVEVTEPFRIGLKRVQSLFYLGETISGTPIETLVADPDNAYWKVSGSSYRKGQQLTVNWFLVTTITIGTPDSGTVQSGYNFEHASAGLDNSKFDYVERTVLIARSSYSSTSPAMGAAMEDLPASMFTGFVLADRKQGRVPDMAIDSTLVVEKRTYVKKTTIRQLGVDSLNGAILYEDTTLYFATETTPAAGSPTAATLFADLGNAYWGLQDTGIQRTGRQISTAWYAIITEQVVGGAFTDGVVIIDEVTGNQDYYWPPVLDEIDFMDWVKLDAGVEIYPAIRFHPEGYNGPCACTTVRKWSPDPFEIEAIEIMQPTRVYYSCPYFTLNVSECLHGEVVPVCDIGNTDPVYAENVGSSRYFAATSPATWPAEIVAYDDQESFRGGYIRTTKTILQPPIPDNIDWTTGVPIP